MLLKKVVFTKHFWDDEIWENVARIPRDADIEFISWISTLDRSHFTPIKYELCHEALDDLFEIPGSIRKIECRVYDNPGDNRYTIKRNDVWWKLLDKDGLTIKEWSIPYDVGKALNNLNAHTSGFYISVHY